MANAYTQLADVVVPSVFANYSREESVEVLDVFEAGLLYVDPKLSGKFDNGGKVINVPAWKQLPGNASEPVNDDPTDNIETKKIGTRNEMAFRHVRAQAWAAPDLTAVLAGDDPVKEIVDQQSDYWKGAMKKSLIGSLNGIIADNIANDGGSLVRDTNTSIADSDVIKAAYLQGDQASGFVGIWMHSKVHQILVENDLIDFIPASKGDLVLPFYQGLRVLMDDGLPVSSGEYTSFLFKKNAVLYEEMPYTGEGGPVEVERKPLGGHGGGSTNLVARRQFVMHPRGWRAVDGSIAGEFPTDAELALAANWDFVASSVKHAGIVALKTTEA